MSARSVAPPLLVVLHGHASSPTDAAALADQLDPHRAFRHVIPAGPVVVGQDLGWFDDSAESVLAAADTVAALIEGLVEDQPGEVVAVGYSQGAAALLAALTAPRNQRINVAGVACISGFLPDATGTEWDLGRLRGVEVFVQHGRDDDVVPAFMAKDLAALLEEAGASLTYEELHMGHERTPESIASARAWLSALDLGPGS